MATTLRPEAGHSIGSDIVSDCGKRGRDACCRRFRSGEPYGWRRTCGLQSVLEQGPRIGFQMGQEIEFSLSAAGHLGFAKTKSESTATHAWHCVPGRVPGLHGEPPAIARKRGEADRAQKLCKPLSSLGKPLSEGEFGGPGGLGPKRGVAVFETVPFNRSGTSPQSG
jgi:hypothetical protein